MPSLEASWAVEGSQSPRAGAGDSLIGEPHYENSLLQMMSCTKIFYRWAWRANSCNILIGGLPSLTTVKYHSIPDQGTPNYILARNNSVMWRKHRLEGQPVFLIISPTLGFTFCGSWFKILSGGKEPSKHKDFALIAAFPLSCSKQSR